MKEKKKSLRVLQVVPSLEMGGVERGTIDMAVFLKNKLSFPVVASAGGRLVSLLRKNEIIHEYLPLNSKNPFTIWRNGNRLAQLVKKHRINIIHARSRAPAWSAYFASKKTKVPLITTFHGIYSINSKLKKFYNSIMTRGNLVIAVSKSIASHIQAEYGISKKKIVTIYRGVDFSIFDPSRVSELRIEAVASGLQLPDDKYVILLPGRLTRWKGHTVLLEAMSRLKRDDFIVLFVGLSKNKSYTKELEDQAVTYGVRDRVYIASECKDMPALYRLATAVICPSTRPEPFGRVAAEAGAMGCPVIASDLGGFKETIIPGETGYLFPSEDSQGLADLIEKILDLTPTQRKIMGERAMEYIRTNFDNKTMFSKTFKVYEEVLS